MLSRFHDAPVVSCKFNFDDASFYIVAELWNDESEVYERLGINFKGVLSLKSSEIEITGLQIEDINSIDVIEQDAVCNVKVILNLGFGKPVWVLELLCKNINIIPADIMIKDD